MDAMPMHAGGAASMTWTRMPGQTWPGFAASFLVMWMTMMVPMMVPPFAAMLWRLQSAAGATGLDRPSAMLALGYFGVWSAIGAVFWPVAMALSAAAATPSTIVIGAMVVAAIVWLSRRKTRRATAQREPMSTDRTLPASPGAAWRRGILLGLQCTRRCGPLMFAAALVAGMDYRVMTGVTAFVTLERLLSA